MNTSAVTPIQSAIPDLRALIDAVYLRSTNLRSPLHGPQHWQAVCDTGLELIGAGEAANPAVVFTFALLHDSQRFNDDHDPDHGPRAAKLIPDLQRTVLHLTAAEQQQLTEACSTHTDAVTATDPTIAVCLDAARLNLWRVGIWPDPRYLSTASGRDPGRIRSRCERCLNKVPWQQLYDQYTKLPAPAV